MKPTVNRSAAPLLVVTFYPTITEAEVRAHFQEMGAAGEELDRAGVVVDLSDAPRLTPSLWIAGSTEMRAALRRWGHKVVGAAHVIRSAPARAMLAAVQWLAPPPFPTLVTPSFEEARSWTLARLDQPVPRPTPAPISRRDARLVARLAGNLVATAKALGIPLDDGDLRTLGLGRPDLEVLDAYVPYGAVMRLLALLEDRSRDANFGLRAGATHTDRASFGVVGLAAASSATLGEAIPRLVRYARLIDENVEMTFTSDSAGGRITLRPLPPLEWPRQYAEFLLASLLALAHLWTGVRFGASAAGFRHGPPRDPAEHAGLFGCAPSFGAAENYIVIPAAMLSQELPQADPVQGGYFDARLDELVRARGVASGPLADVRAAALRQLSNGTPTVASIARDLGMSSRTLQRRLNERGAAFGDILDSARREAAMAAFTRPDASVQEIASSIGFADLRAFRRAFVRWTGKSPGEYRRLSR